MKRKVIRIIEERCNGCGICVKSCVEGAIQVINGKAVLINEVFCDGLGACVGSCPQGAIVIEEREAKKYDEIKTLKNIIKHGEEAVIAHLKHLKSHGEENYFKQAIEYIKKHKIKVDLKKLKENHNGCHHAQSMEIRKADNSTNQGKIRSELTQWPIQFHLVNPYAEYFKDADVLITADCTAFSYGDFHRDFIKGKKIIIGCPKLDKDIERYIEKLKILIDETRIKSLNVITMEVPCCFGLVEIVNQALRKSKRKLPIEHTIITIDGHIMQD